MWDADVFEGQFGKAAGGEGDISGETDGGSDAGTEIGNVPLSGRPVPQNNRENEYCSCYNLNLDRLQPGSKWIIAVCCSL
jgi:hypothetical protein